MSRIIKLVPHDPLWKNLFNSEQLLLRDIFKKICLDIHHIGSTAIPLIFSKPIIDILLVAETIDSVDLLNDELSSAGYISKGEYGIRGRRYFIKGTEASRLVHLHCFDVTDSLNINRHVFFRNYLINNPSIALKYSNLKLKLQKEFQGNPDNYIKGKSEFIANIERIYS